MWEGKSRWDGPEYACIRGEACDRDADVIVDAEHLLLVRRELSARALGAERAKVSNMVKRDACARRQRGASHCCWCWRLRAQQGGKRHLHCTYLESEENGMIFGSQADRC